jgi:hypothetical protein
LEVQASFVILVKFIIDLDGGLIVDVNGKLMYRCQMASSCIEVNGELMAKIMASSWRALVSMLNSFVDDYVHVEC